MTNKILRGELENDSIQHEHETSTPKHNRSRKKLRRSIKRKETKFWEICYEEEI
jgi:hypothetical protein